jgi:hypothetical protein
MRVSRGRARVTRALCYKLPTKIDIVLTTSAPLEPKIGHSWVRNSISSPSQGTGY